MREGNKTHHDSPDELFAPEDAMSLQDGQGDGTEIRTNDNE